MNASFSSDTNPCSHYSGSAIPDSISSIDELRFAGDIARVLQLGISYFLEIFTKKISLFSRRIHVFLGIRGKCHVVDFRKNIRAVGNLEMLRLLTLFHLARDVLIHEIIDRVIVFGIGIKSDSRSRLETLAGTSQGIVYQTECDQNEVFDHDLAKSGGRVLFE